MKLILAAVLLLSIMAAETQETLRPNSNAIERKWLANQSYQMTWYVLKDTMRVEIGKVNTQITVTKDVIIVVSQINIKQRSSGWVDSTIARTRDLSPVYHSSYNAQRDMVLKFGQVVTGFYRDKMTNNETVIADTTSQQYFDSNLYPTLITWLPLQEGYKQDIAIYDYKPGGETGVLKAAVHEVKKGKFQTKQSGIRDVLVVTVSDEIGGSANGFSTYYIDVKDRRIWKQQIEAGGRTMEMVLTEK